MKNYTAQMKQKKNRFNFGIRFGMIFLTLFIVNKSSAFLEKKCLEEINKLSYNKSCKKSETAFHFCSSKTLDNIETLIEKGEIDEKTIYRFLFMLNNKVCIKEKRQQIDKLLFRIIRLNAKGFLHIYKSCSSKLKQEVITEMNNPISNRNEIRAAIDSLSYLQNTEMNIEIEELLNAMEKGIEKLSPKDKIKLESQVH